MNFLESTRIEKLAALFLFIASLLLGLMAVGSFQNLLEPRPPVGSMISVEGTGKVTAIPDVARITFAVFEEGTTASEAQEKASQKSNTALALLEGFGIDEKDIKTISYSVSPKYSRPQPCFNGFCPEYEQRITGFTTSQTIEVKVRDTAQSGDVLSALGTAGVSNLSGPSFTIDDPDALREQARAEAIKDARAKAKTLAKDLGVQLVRVTGFWENTGPYPYYAESAKAYGFGGADSAVSSTPEIPAGENEIISTISVTYEIR